MTGKPFPAARRLARSDDHAEPSASHEFIHRTPPGVLMALNSMAASARCPMAAPVRKAYLRPWAMGCRWLAAILALAPLILPGQLAGADGIAWAQKAKTRVAIAPITDLRGGEDRAWIARHLEDGIRDALLYTQQFAVMPVATAGLWEARRALRPGATPTPEHLQAMGVDFLLWGTIHRVLRLVRVKVRMASADPDYFADEISWEWQVDLQRDSPRDAIERAMAHILPTLARPAQIRVGLESESGPAPSRASPQPAGWELVEAFHRVIGREAQSQPDLAARVVALTAFQNEQGLRGKSLGATAETLLVQALLYVPDNAARKPMLESALKAAAAAAKAEPWNSRWLALKGEIHYLLRQDYEAKTEASVARLRNPLDGLAYLVLGMVAGVSTARGNDWMNAALAADPFLRANNRPAGSPPFQGGVLEPYFANWQRLHAQRREWNSPEFDRQLKLGQQLFSQRQWDEAEAAFQAAAGTDASDHRPLLYLARILTETGRPAEAATDLRSLSGEYPEEWDIWFHLGLALTGAQRHAQAEEAFRHSLELNPVELQPLYHLAESQMFRKNWGGARMALRRYLEHKTHNARAWTFLGICETHLEHWPQAAHAFRRALAIDPNQDQARKGLANAAQHLAK